MARNGNGISEIIMAAKKNGGVNGGGKTSASK